MHHGTSDELRVRAVLPVPSGFVGHVAHDPASKRLWLVSLGPPANTRGPSTLYEIDPTSGRVLQRAELPLVGEFGAPVHRDGQLYLGLYHQRRIHRIDLAAGPTFGRIAETIEVSPLTTLDLSAHRDQVFRYPFFAFTALTQAADGWLTHSEDLGQFLLLDRDSGRVVRQITTQPSLQGLAALPGPGGRTLVLANSNPREFAMRSYMRRFQFRGAAPPPPMGATELPEESGTNWLLLDLDTGEVLASVWHSPSRAKASSIALISAEPVEGTPFGRFLFYTLGAEGVLKVEWTPSTLATTVIHPTSAQ